jgi:prevent-host-death family protein
VAYPLTAAQTHLADLVAEARQSHRPVTISEDGKPVAAVINIDDLATLRIAPRWRRIWRTRRLGATG